MLTLEQQFGNLDIYLFDQLLKGRIAPGMRVLDAGCGYGRNLVYLLREQYEVYGVDSDAESVAAVRQMAGSLHPQLTRDHFRVESIENMSFPEAYFDVVVSNAVLHFARDDAHFVTLVHAMWRVLKPGSVFFCRLASTIGMAHAPVFPDNAVGSGFTGPAFTGPALTNRRVLSPDGAERYAVDAALLLDMTTHLGGQLLDPLKTTIVQDQRCMTTWVVRKND